MKDINCCREKAKSIIPYLKKAKSVGIVILGDFEEILENEPHMDLFSQIIKSPSNYSDIRVLIPEYLSCKKYEIFKAKYNQTTFRNISKSFQKKMKNAIEYNDNYYSIVFSEKSWDSDSCIKSYDDSFSEFVELWDEKTAHELEQIEQKNPLCYNDKKPEPTTKTEKSNPQIIFTKDQLIKKSLENLLSKVKKVPPKKVSKELLNQCYFILKPYETILTKAFDDFSKEFKSFRVHSESKHHMPNVIIIQMLKEKMEKYLNYTINNIENFSKI